MTSPSNSIRSVCVFCGAKPGRDDRFLVLARDAGRALARRGLTVVYGGGHVGLMGAVADAALAAGGQVIGVIPQQLMDREVGHKGLTRLEVVPDMAFRKERMIELSDAFISLPGGLGTLDEMFEVLTLRQLHQHAKPSGLLNADGYYDLLVAAWRSFVDQGLIDRREIDRIHVEPTIDALLDALLTGDARPA
ncbi:MAG: TIGR00730 family Rossman fold protein [Burkholderiaceae bacterium]